jgi:large subunit ribosomal protein L32
VESVYAAIQLKKFLNNWLILNIGALCPPSLTEFFMAVQQNKKSPSKRGMHRSHNALNLPGIAVEPTTGESHLRHHISPTGFYRGRKVLKTKTEA